MKIVQNGYRGLTFMFGLNVDRLLAVVIVAGALVLAAYVAKMM